MLREYTKNVINVNNMLKTSKIAKKKCIFDIFKNLDVLNLFNIFIL